MKISFIIISFLMSFISLQVFAASEVDVKLYCQKKAGGKFSQDPKSIYQTCLKQNAIMSVKSNAQNGDKSRADARVCDSSNPVCRSCLSRFGTYGAGKVTECIQVEQKKQQQSSQAAKDKTASDKVSKNKTAAAKEQKPAKPAQPTQASSKSVSQAAEAATSKATQALCTEEGGQWNSSGQCLCLAGDTQKVIPFDEKANQYIASCPRLQALAENCESDYGVGGTFYTGDSVDKQGRCVCENQKEFLTSPNESFFGKSKCSTQTKAEEQSPVDQCLAELKEKVDSCSSASTNAVNKCDSENKSTNGDTITSLQQALGGATAVMQNSGAADACMNASIVGSTGYYALDALRNKCDDEIKTCKNDCSSAIEFINANKFAVYERCKASAVQSNIDLDSLGGSTDTSNTESLKEQYDIENKAKFAEQIQQMLETANEKNSVCESGPAVSNKEKLLKLMDTADNAVKSAGQCTCQLSSNNGGTDCSNVPGPAQCALNPYLKGCSQATINCLSPQDQSPKCVCFKNPNGELCKNYANSLAKSSGGSGISGFAGFNQNPFQPSTDSSLKGQQQDMNTDLSGLDLNEARKGTSDTVTADIGSPFGAATPSGSPGGGAGPGGSGSGESTNNANSDSDGTEKKGISGLFQTAKGALSSLFSGKTGNQNSSTNFKENYNRGANDNLLGQANKWRPRGSIRGIAGHDSDIGGKFEDIWKVMNKQYKVQDQKDNFIIGENK